MISETPRLIKEARRNGKSEPEPLERARLEQAPHRRESMLAREQDQRPLYPAREILALLWP